MPGRKFAESEKIRKWIKMALKNGCDSPRQVLEYIEQNASDLESPTMTTIGYIMRDEGYIPAGYKWEKA